jgi:prevent-host-death family protein
LRAARVWPKSVSMVMTMEPHMGARVVKASEFKATCLKLMDEVNETGEIIVITKNGKPVAELFPPRGRRRSPFGLHKGEGYVLDDVDRGTGEEWEAER